MTFNRIDRPLLVVVGSGGVGKTTLAAALGLASAAGGTDTLVMTFDPSLRLKDALGVGEEASRREVRVEVDAPGRLDVSLLDARRTFDRLIRQYAPSEAAAERIFGNRFYQHLAGNLAGILEYMAVERLFEVASSRRYQRIILDTPPTRQALDFLEAPDRIIEFLESGPVRLALRPWFDASGRLVAAPLKLVGRSLESWLDRLVGLELLRDMAEFFQAFGPLYDGFRQRAGEVRELLRARGTLFLLVAGPGSERIPDTLFFARRLREAGLHLGPIVVNQVHPQVPAAPPAGAGSRALAGGLHLIAWLGQRDHQGLAELRSLLGAGDVLVDLPLLPDPPTDLSALSALGDRFLRRLAAGR
jgi:anion-transporting  ArsA/GET3 family ATPase